MVMKKVLKHNNPPETLLITKDFGKTDYCDSYEVSLATSETVDEITGKIFSLPSWIGSLMKIRAFIVRPFGLKTDDKKPNDHVSEYRIGSDDAFFNVINRNDDEIVMGESVKHLDFRTSVLIIRDEGLTFVYLTTIVKYNNLFGRMYFQPVKPFHGIIIKSILRRLKSNYPRQTLSQMSSSGEAGTKGNENRLTLNAGL